MIETPLRKFVKPAHPGARIPDLDHNTDLPQDGAAVVWNAYWAGREMRGEIVVSPEPAPAAAPSAKAPPA